MKTIRNKNTNQLICTVAQDSGIIGYVVIDIMVGGRSQGGLRMLADIDEEEIRGLARSMTLKYGFLGLLQGGAKAGVRGNPEASQRERWLLLEAFGRAIAALLRSCAYIPNTDMGTTNTDIRHMLESLAIRIKRRELRGAAYVCGGLQLPDLIVLSIETDPVVPEPGELVNVSITVKNRGLHAADAFISIGMPIFLPLPPHDAGDRYERVNSLAPGDTYIMDTTWSYFTAGEYNMYSQVDTDEEVTEWNETNNVLGPVPVLVAACEGDFDEDGDVDVRGEF